MERDSWSEMKNDDLKVKSEFDERIGDLMWKYEQLRAGRVYAQFMFNTREEAESFATQMTRVQPDLFGRIEPVEARAIWN